MAKRRKMTKHHSKKSFRKGAVRVHKFNMPKRIAMRGGIRM